jgi:tRNA pseudouridine55 synthase
MLMLLGSSTRLAEYFVPMDKEYLATARLGVFTSTDDAEGEPSDEDDRWLDLPQQEVEEVLTAFQGPLSQVPPAYSAKKVRGQPAHRRIRRGEEVDLAPSPVEIREIRLTDFDLPSVSFFVRCSSGTYVRALARDLGERLRVGAHLTHLQRTAIGSFRLDEALSMECLRDPEAVAGAVVDPADAMSHLPAREVGPQEARQVLQGQSIPPGEDELPEDTPIAILRAGELLAVGHREGERLRPRKVLVRG